MENYFGTSDGDDALVLAVREKLDRIAGLERDIESLLARFSHSHDPVRRAAEHFARSLQVLQATIETAVRKNAENPELGDHPPRTMDVS